MRHFWIGSMAAALLLSIAPSAWGDATTSPGKTAVYVSQSGVTVSNSGLDPLAPDVSGTIAKGKKKRVLEIDLTLTDEGSSSNGIGVRPTVNGFSDVVQPTPGSGFQLSECPAGTWVDCTVSGHFWVDLDAAETAHAGMFINQPLVIQMKAVADTVITANGNASLRAHMQKK